MLDIAFWLLVDPCHFQQITILRHIILRNRDGAVVCLTDHAGVDALRLALCIFFGIERRKHPLPRLCREDRRSKNETTASEMKKASEAATAEVQKLTDELAAKVKMVEEQQAKIIELEAASQ